MRDVGRPVEHAAGAAFHLLGNTTQTGPTVLEPSVGERDGDLGGERCIAGRVALGDVQSIGALARCHDAVCAGLYAVGTGTTGRTGTIVIERARSSEHHGAVIVDDLPRRISAGIGNPRAFCVVGLAEHRVDRVGPDRHDLHHRFVIVQGDGLERTVFAAHSGGATIKRGRLAVGIDHSCHGRGGHDRCGRCSRRGDTARRGRSRRLIRNGGGLFE